MNISLCKKILLKAVEPAANMRHAFIVNGYGVPKDITKNDNYRFYLHGVFNAVYDTSVAKKSDAVVLFAGGKTDMFPPYKRDEATEMLKYFRTLADRPFVKTVTKDWKLEKEGKSLSGLENLLFAKDILKKKYPKIEEVTIAFEKSREERIKKIAKKVFPDKKLSFLPVDFSVSETRYDLELSNKKESWALKVDLWALESPAHLKEHHQIYVEKVKAFRAAGPSHQEEAIKKWWQMVVSRLEKTGL